MLWSGLHFVRTDVVSHLLLPPERSSHVMMGVGDAAYEERATYSPIPDVEVVVPIPACASVLQYVRQQTIKRSLAFKLHVRRLDSARGLRSWTGSHANSRFCSISLVYLDYAKRRSVHKALAFFEDVSRTAERLGGASHRGKLYANDPRTLLMNVDDASREAFEKYRTELDPSGKFQSTWTRSLKGRNAGDAPVVLSPNLDVRAHMWRVAVTIAFAFSLLLGVVSVFLMVLSCVTQTVKWKPLHQRGST